MFMLVITVDLVLLLVFLAVPLLRAIAIFSYLLSRVSPLLALFFFFSILTFQELRYAVLCVEGCVWALFVCVKRPNLVGCQLVLGV